jgi:hypothetical protein
VIEMNEEMERRNEIVYLYVTNKNLPYIHFGGRPKHDVFAELRRKGENVYFEWKDMEFMTELEEALICAEMFK